MSVCGGEGEGGLLGDGVFMKLCLMKNITLSLNQTALAQNHLAAWMYVYASSPLQRANQTASQHIFTSVACQFPSV